MHMRNMTKMTYATVNNLKNLNADYLSNIETFKHTKQRINIAFKHKIKTVK